MPFEIVEAGGCRVVTNGTLSVVIADDVPEATAIRKRAISGIPMSPPAEVVVPQLNELSGRLLKDGGSAQDVKNAILAIAGTVITQEPKHHEAGLIEVGGVRIYLSDNTVTITRRELQWQ